MLNAFRPLPLLLATLAVAMPAVAQDAVPAAPEIRSQREDAGARIRQVERAGGRVLQAEPMQRGGQEVYRFKVLTPEGRVRVLQGDPRNVREARPDRDPRGERDPRAERAGTRVDRPGFDRLDELTARRRDFRDDDAAEMPRERPQRSSRPPSGPDPRAAGNPAGD